MRIKLRLYPRDLDLLTLKQTCGFNLGAVTRQAVYEYVKHGECSRIYIPVYANQEVVLKNDQIDITFAEGKYDSVIEWLSNIRPGMRNSAVKAIVRSAIANPILTAYMNNSNLIISDKQVQAYISEKTETAVPSQSRAKGMDTASMDNGKHDRNDGYTHNQSAAQNDDDFDIFDFAENY